MTNEELLQRYMYIRLRALQGKADERLGVVIRKLARDLMTAKSRIAEEFRKRAEKLKAPRDADGFFDERADALAKHVAAVIAKAAAEEGVEAFEGAQSILSVDGHARNVRLARGLTAEQFEQIATRQPLNSRSLAQWTERCFEKNLPEKVLAALEEGMVMAEGIGPMSRRIRAALDEGMTLAANEAAMLARTYVQAANIGAQAAVYRQNEDVIKGYKWLATLDNRTCQNCAVGDGHVYGVHDKRPNLPLHPGCRCLWLPVTKSFRELGLDIDEFREAERPWTIRKDGAIGYGGKEIEQVGRIEGRFKDWYFSLPPEDRARTSIGVTRRMLLESGAIKWDDMMDFETGRIRTLAELGFTERGRSLLEDAKSGIRHKGTYLDGLSLPVNQVKKGIRSLEKQIQTHFEKIADPEKAIGAEEILDEVKRNRLIDKWNKDITRQKELIYLLTKALEERGEKP